MKKISYLLVFIILLAGQSAYAENIKIGFVDLIKALNESDSGKKAKADLESLIKSKQTAINEKGNAIEKLQSDFEKQSSVLSSEARKSKEKELEKLIIGYKRLVSDSHNEVKKRENEFTGEIIKEIRAIVEKIGQENGYTMIIENIDGLILYSKKGLDLTKTIVKRYNESKAEVKK